MKTRTLDADQVIAEICEVLRMGDGEFIQDIANQVLVPELKYDGDSLFIQRIQE